MDGLLERLAKIIEGVGGYARIVDSELHTRWHGLRFIITVRRS